MITKCDIFCLRNNVLAILYQWPSKHVSMGFGRGGQNGHFAPVELVSKNQKIPRKSVVSSFLINWFNFCNGILIANMTLTLHECHVHCCGVMQ